MTAQQVKDALDRCQHAQNLQADEMERLAYRITELEKQIEILKGQKQTYGY